VNRKELFLTWWEWSLKYRDCDPAVWLTNYLHGRYEHNREQRYWLAWLYGHTYQLPTSWVLMNEFPDFELATKDRLDKWNTDNYKRLRYQTDTKWNKGHLPEMWDSYKTFVKTYGKGSQHDALTHFNQGDAKKTFDVLWTKLLQDLHKFGRYMTWYYLQHLKHTCYLPIEPTSLMLNDYEGSRSHRNGLLYALGMEDKVDAKLTSGETVNLESQATELLQELRKRRKDMDVDFFTMETCLCSFKKLFREHNGRYLGYYLDRQAEEIQQASIDGWDGIEWNVLWQARAEMLDPRLDHRRGIDKALFPHYLNTGKLHRAEWLTGQSEPEFDDSPFGAFLS
jgi:hypothetical protein